MGIIVPIAPGGGGGPPTGPAGGDLGNNYPNPSVLKLNGTAVPAGPSLGQLLVALSGVTSGWENPLPILASAYGVSPANADNTAALNAAFVAGAGGTVILPPGLLKHVGALTATDCNIVGAGIVATTLQCTAQLGAGIPALTAVSNPGWYLRISDFSMLGPGAPALGVKTANCVGLELQGNLAGSGFIRDMAIQQFDSGIVVNNTSGHVYLTGLLLTNNYYGLYVVKQGGDFDVIDCAFVGNTWAGIACVAGVGMNNWLFQKSHLGFGPYGIYEEALPAAQGAGIFLDSVDMRQVSFEAIGNAAIWSDATDTVANHSITAVLRITDCGFSWAGGAAGSSAIYTLPAKTANYAVKLGTTSYTINVEDGVSPFTAGLTNPAVAAAAATAGIFYINTANHVSFNRRDNTGALAAPTDLTVGSGSPNYFWGTKPIMGTAAAGSFIVLGADVAVAASPTITTILTLGPLQVGDYKIAAGLDILSAGNAFLGDMILTAGTATATFNGQATLAKSVQSFAANLDTSGEIGCHCRVTVAGTIVLQATANVAATAKHVTASTGHPGTYLGAEAA